MPEVNFSGGLQRKLVIDKLSYCPTKSGLAFCFKPASIIYVKLFDEFFRRLFVKSQSVNLRNPKSEIKNQKSESEIWNLKFEIWNFSK